MVPPGTEQKGGYPRCLHDGCDLVRPRFACRMRAISSRTAGRLQRLFQACGERGCPGAAVAPSRNPITVRCDRPTHRRAAQRASVGSTEAAKDVVARVGVVGRVPTGDRPFARSRMVPPGRPDIRRCFSTFLSGYHLCHQMAPDGDPTPRDIMIVGPAAPAGRRMTGGPPRPSPSQATQVA